MNHCFSISHGHEITLMKRLLRHKESGLYFAPDGGWVSDWRKAMPISDLTNILATCKEHELPQIEFVLKSEAGEYGVTLDVWQARIGGVPHFLYTSQIMAKINHISEIRRLHEFDARRNQATAFPAGKIAAD